jgi:hypothetical protein
MDLAGGMSTVGWGCAFGLVALLMAEALAAFILINPRELAGDRRE